MARIFVVDDDPDFVDLVDMALFERGDEALTCDIGLDPIHYAARERPDAILLDLHLPSGQDGWTLLGRLRDNPATAAIPVVICSAATDALRRRNQEIQDQGITILAKPFDLDEFDAVLDGLLRARSEGAGGMAPEILLPAIPTS